MKTFQQFLIKNITKEDEQHIVDLLDKIDVGNIEMLSDEEFENVMIELLELSTSDKISDETRNAVIDKLTEIHDSLTVIVKHAVKHRDKLDPSQKS